MSVVNILTANNMATERMMRWLVSYTLVWVAVHIPLETFVTVELAGISGLRYGAYLMNWPGFVMLTLGAISGRKGRPFSAGLLTGGWSWIAAMFWRATSDRFRFAELYGGVSGHVWGAGKGGSSELVIACVLTALACLGLLGALRVLYVQGAVQRFS